MQAAFILSQGMSRYPTNKVKEEYSIKKRPRISLLSSRVLIFFIGVSFPLVTTTLQL